MSEKGRILIVDDDLMVAESLKAILESKDYDNIQVTESALEALQYLNNASFDCAILDVMMPDMTGFDIMDSLDKENMDTLFIIMTGDNSVEYAIEAVR
jgi:DNA-binding NtrC family response regulator